MTKLGRPGISYENFIEVWVQLIKENRASINSALAIIGGSKGTIAGFRERYEREQSSKEMSILKSIEGTETIHLAIAAIKVKEVTVLEKNNTQLKSRIDDFLVLIKELEENLASAQIDIIDAKANFDVEKLSIERQLAAAQARIEDITKREQQLNAKFEKTNEQLNQAKQEAAVAKKETEMLRKFTDKNT
jgi:chromosome segregation ATPase